MLDKILWLPFDLLNVLEIKKVSTLFILEILRNSKLNSYAIEQRYEIFKTLHYGGTKSSCATS